MASIRLNILLRFQSRLCFALIDDSVGEESVDVLLAMFEAKVATGARFDVTKYNLMHS